MLFMNRNQLRSDYLRKHSGNNCYACIRLQPPIHIDERDLCHAPASGLEPIGRPASTVDRLVDRLSDRGKHHIGIRIVDGSRN
jgi:hypothetical protein